MRTRAVGVVLLGALLQLVAASRPWATGRVAGGPLAGSPLSATGAEAAPAAVAGAVVALAALAVLLAGPRRWVRWAAAGGLVLATLVTFLAVGPLLVDPSDALGAATQPGGVSAARPTVWAWSALAGAALFLLGALLVGLPSRAARPRRTGARRDDRGTQTEQRRRADAATWAALSDGHDPTLDAEPDECRDEPPAGTQDHGDPA